jgi:hypothetical protein
MLKFHVRSDDEKRETLKKSVNTAPQTKKA